MRSSASAFCQEDTAFDLGCQLPSVVGRAIATRWWSTWLRKLELLRSNLFAESFPRSRLLGDTFGIWWNYRLSVSLSFDLTWRSV